MNCEHRICIILFFSLSVALAQEVYDDEACGGSRPKIVTEHNGVLTSRNYPGLYPNNEDCQWRLESPEENSAVRLQFTAFNTEPAYDVVRLYDGPDLSSNLLDTAHGVSYPARVVTSGDAMFVRFVTDWTGQRSGWRAKFTTDKACSSHRPRVVSDVNGTITSPFYSDPYGNEHQCEWLIEAEPGQTLSLTFTDFELETCCTCDWVEVYDGPDTDSPSLGRYCGEMLPPMKESTGHQLYVVFNSDDNGVYPGFSLDFETIGDALPPTTTMPPETTTEDYITTEGPTEAPTDEPTEEPTDEPTEEPTTVPTTTPPTTTPPTTTPESTAEPPYEWPLLLSSLNGTIRTSTGDPLSQQCLRDYQSVMTDRARTILTNINLIIDDVICDSEQDGFMLWNLNSVMLGYGEVTVVLLDAVLRSSPDVSLADHISCAIKLTDYLGDHSNWPSPILPLQPGCPPVSFEPAMFDFTQRKWECPY